MAKLDLTNLLSAVSDATTVDASAAAMISNQAALTKAAVEAALADDVAANAAAQTAIDGVTTQLLAGTKQVADAIVANTPAAPPTV